MTEHIHSKQKLSKHLACCRPSIALAISILSSWLLFGSTAVAQVQVTSAATTTPVLHTVTPFVFRPGQTAKVKFAGLRLADIRGVLSPAPIQWLSGKDSEPPAKPAPGDPHKQQDKAAQGKTAQGKKQQGKSKAKPQAASNDGKQVTLQLALPADAPVGWYPIYLLTKTGLSNPRLIRVDRIPSTAKTTASKTAPDKLALGHGVTGTLAASRFDYFQFAGNKGDQVTIDLEADRLGSLLRGTLTVYDSQGREIAHAWQAADSRFSDPRIQCTLPATGSYLLRVGDRLHHGGDGYHYYLRAGARLETGERTVSTRWSKRKGRSSRTVPRHAANRDDSTRTTKPSSGTANSPTVRRQR